MPSNESSDFHHLMDTHPVNDEGRPILPSESPRALLIGVYHGGSDLPTCQEHLEELHRLADTYGAETIEVVACPLRKIDPATFLGSGKIDELVALAKEKSADLILFDEEISPAQQRNLEKLFGLTVMDRTELIIEVFALHAHTKEAQLQIQLAQYRYQFPRLKRMWTHLHRQRGGGVYVKGEGEKQIEIDRRLLETKIEKVQKDLAEVRMHRQTQRSARVRSSIPVFAIVGYTNAGKSTLLNALTHAGVLVEDKLFATLDTTTRKFTLPNRQNILLTDTVGFIRKLPHQLIEAFKSTLEEAVYADILLHVIDASHPTSADQAKATIEVLKELKAADRPMLTILNKVDQCAEGGQIDRLRLLFSKTVQISALSGQGLEDLQQLMIDELAKLRREVSLKIPQSEYSLVSEIMDRGEVLDQVYVDNDIELRARIPSEMLYKVEQYLQP